MPGLQACGKQAAATHVCVKAAVLATTMMRAVLGTPAMQHCGAACGSVDQHVRARFSFRRSRLTCMTATCAALAAEQA